MLRQDPSLDEVDPLPTPVEAPPAAAPVEAPAPSRGSSAATRRSRWSPPPCATPSAGRGRVVVVSGEPGIGKTRFTEAAGRPRPSAGARCRHRRLGGRGEPAAVGLATRADARCSATRSSSTPATCVDAASASFRQADALMAAAVRSGSPSLLVLDDVHWADAESLRLLRRLATQLDSLPLVVVVATRSAEAEIGPALAEALAAIARLDPVRVELAGLDADAIAAWVSEHAGVAVTEEVAAPWPSAPTATPST